MNKLYTILSTLIVLLMFSCQHKHKEQHDHDCLNHDTHEVESHEEHNHDTHESEDHEGHNHNEELDEHEGHNHGSYSRTIIQDGYEVFLETNHWLLNESADISIFLTNLSDYSPVPLDEIELLISGDAKQSIHAHAHGKGIYHASFTPTKAGLVQIRIGFKINKQLVNLYLKDLPVHSNHNELPAPKEEVAGLIEFHKEQAWSENFGLELINYTSTPRLIKVSGEIMPAPGDEFILTAMHGGTVSLNKTLIEGKQISAGEVISTISSSLIHENMTNKYLKAKNEYEKADIDYKRARNLIDEKLISEKEYLEAKLNYESSKNTFDIISKYYNNGNQQVKSPTNGYIRTVFVKEGQYIDEGQPIATIIRNKRILLKAYIPQQYNHLSSGIFDANFSPVYTSEIYSIKQLNGSRISYSSALPDNSQFVPLYFEIDAHKDIMPGSYTEIYLKSASFENKITVPESALQEDQGNYYVFVQKGGEQYLKTYVSLGDSDGYRTIVNKGLSVGDVVVSKGAYQVYLSSLGESAPAHTHSH